VSVDINDLTASEQAVLLVLMAESRPVSNPELARLGPELRAPNRAKLNRLKLIDSTITPNFRARVLRNSGGIR